MPALKTTYPARKTSRGWRMAVRPFEVLGSRRGFLDPALQHLLMVQQIDFTDKTDDIAAQQSKVRTSLMFDHAIV
jgi:hypothetical protein